MAVSADYPLGQGCLLWSQPPFFPSGLIWTIVLAPVQVQQARLAKSFAAGEVNQAYRSLSRRWLVWGIVSTFPLVVATWLMVAKPG
ncbi:MAG: DUF2269 family protein [Oceanicaulis sp.]|nr:DUF2269 family protein [Oceanicaulis sp.]MCH8522899.1 DUF2269 domain-containing protein [Glycocaulis sp.]